MYVYICVCVWGGTWGKGNVVKFQLELRGCTTLREFGGVNYVNLIKHEQVYEIQRVDQIFHSFWIVGTYFKI